MSTLSELKKRGGPRVRVRAASSKKSNSDGGEAVDLILSPREPGPLGDAFEVARTLKRAGVALRISKIVLDRLTARDSAYVRAPFVADFAQLKRAIESQNVSVRRIDIRGVDVKALRARLGISQEDFAGRFGLDVATVRNWEQGRTRPDGPARALLQAIERDPETIVKLLAP